MNKLSIGYDKFNELYPDIGYKQFVVPPANEEEFTTKQLTSKLWRMNNLYTIVDKDGNRIPFVMNKSQHKVHSAYLKHPRLVILKSRQQGISTYWLIFFLDECLFYDDINTGLMSQGKKESSKLLKRIKLAWDTLDQSIKDFLQVGLDKDNSEEFSFNNGSTVYVSTSFRSATLQGLHISEYGKIANKYPERAKETRTGSMQAIKAGLPVVIESTAEGANDFETKWDNAEELLLSGRPFSGKDFYPVFLSWMEDPDCLEKVDQPINKEQADYFDKLEDELRITLVDQQKWFWVSQYRELGDDIYQEYPSTPEEAFTATKDGSYYAKLYREHVIKQKREVKDLYDDNLEVDVAIDLGMNDTFVMVFSQTWQNEERIIDEYYNSGEGLEHYMDVLHSKPYKIGRVSLPHDVKVRELGTGISRLHRLRELGLRNYKVLPKIPVNEGIEAVRKMIPNMWIDPKCTYLISCFKGYSKEWDEKLGVWKNKPLHNEYSNGMDGVRYKAVSRLPSRLKSRQPQRRRGYSGFAI